MPAASAVAGLSPTARRFSPRQEEGHGDGQKDSQIREKTVGKQEISHHSQVGKPRYGRAVSRSRGRNRDLSHTARELCQRSPEKVSEAHTEGGQCQARHVLISPQADGEYAVYQASQSRADEGADKGN